VRPPAPPPFVSGVPDLSIWQLSDKRAQGTCEVCSEPIPQPWTGRKRFTCSASCALERKRRRGEVAAPKPCSFCARTFTASRPGQRYCSPECRHEGSRNNRLEIARRRDRHVRLFGTPRKIGLLEIGERDHWACHICQLPVDRQATGNAKPSLDHVIPVSRGGPHSRENIKLAHLGCNIAKKDRLLSEMAS
jgi:5-methylcytosine-specific restriction endonuclease McrA